MCHQQNKKTLIICKQLNGPVLKLLDLKRPGPKFYTLFRAGPGLKLLPLLKAGPDLN